MLHVVTCSSQVACFKVYHSCNSPLTEPISVDCQCAIKTTRHENNRSSFSAFGSSTRVKFNAETDEPLWAGLMELTGRNWPAGRTLPITDITCKYWKNVSQNASIISTKFHVNPNYCMHFYDTATYRGDGVGVSREGFQALAVFHVPYANALIKLNNHSTKNRKTDSNVS